LVADSLFLSFAFPAYQACFVDFVVRGEEDKAETGVLLALHDHGGAVFADREEFPELVRCIHD